jgi:hypothetical protein
MLEISKFSIGLAKILERGSPCPDGVFQYCTNDRHQRSHARRGNLTCLSFGRDPGAEQSLADVNVTKSSDDSLIK